MTDEVQRELEQCRRERLATGLKRKEAEAEVERLREALEKIAVDGPTNPTRADIAREALNGKESQ